MSKAAKPSLFNKQVTADEIKEALEDKHRNRVRPDLFYTEVKNGSTFLPRDGQLYILDALAIRPSWSDPRFIGYEIKVSRSDFLQDEKWQNYRDYCNEFSFVCPTGLIDSEELPKEVGLMYYNPLKESVRTVRVPQKQTKPPDWPILFYLLLSRDEKRRKSEQQEELEYYLERKRIGR